MLPNASTPSQIRTQEISEVQQAVLQKVVPPQTVGFSLYHACTLHDTVQDAFCAAAHAKFLPNVHCFLPLAPILSPFLAVCLASGFVH